MESVGNYEFDFDPHTETLLSKLVKIEKKSCKGNIVILLTQEY